MKNNQNKDKDVLREVLQGWRISSPLPPRFQEQVWRRIEAAEQADVRGNLQRLVQSVIERLVLRPKLAFSYVTVALAVGLVLGSWQAREETTAVHSDLSQRYVQSIDPYQKPGRL